MKLRAGRSRKRALMRGLIGLRNVWADGEGLGRWTWKDKMGSICMDIGRELERLGMRGKTIKEVGICLGRSKGRSVVIYWEYANCGRFEGYVGWKI